MHDATSYPGDESLRRSYPGDEVVGILKKLQIGAGERRTVPAGHGFKTTATIEVAVDDDERNDAESERRRLEQAAEQPSTKRRPTPAETDDVVRRRKRALTHDRGRNVLGSRQRQRWVHQLDELGELPQGAQRAEAIKALGAQRQRAEAYAAAAARAAPHGGGRTAPVALGSSVPEGLEAAAAAGLSLDDIIKLPSYSMARVANESDEFVMTSAVPGDERVAGGRPHAHGTRAKTTSWNAAPQNSPTTFLRGSSGSSPPPSHRRTSGNASNRAVGAQLVLKSEVGTPTQNRWGRTQFELSTRCAK